MFIDFDVGMVWNHFPWGEKDDERKSDGSSLVLRASRCNEQTRVSQVGERSETVASGMKRRLLRQVSLGNLEMLKYCFSNGCPCDEEES